MKPTLLPESNSQRISTKYIKAKPELRRWNTHLGLDATMLDLEESFITLVNNMDQRIYGLIQRTKEDITLKSKGNIEEEDFEFLKENSEINWKWLESLSQAVQKHVNNVAEYHLFYETLIEYHQSFTKIRPLQLSKLVMKDFEGNYDEANDIFHELKVYLSDYLSWWQKIEFLISRSRAISPIGLRLESSDIKRPLTMLTDYKFNKIILHKNEKVFLVQNETKQRWNVENTKGDIVFNVPSICCELTPPDIQAISDCILLRLELLRNWTITIKEIGHVLMRYIATILGYWTQIDIKHCRNKDERKLNIYKSLYTLESLLNAYRKSSPQLLYLQTKIYTLRATLEMTDDEDLVEDITQIDRNTLFLDIAPQVLESHFESNSSQSFLESESLSVQRRTICILVNLYKEFYKFWDIYRDFMENPSLLALIENIKTTPQNSEEMLIRSSDRFLNYLSVNDDTAWSNYLKLLAENEKNIKDLHSTDVHLINILPKSLELQSSFNTFSNTDQFFHSKKDVLVPAEKELCFFKSNSLPNPDKPPFVDINKYFKSSLLPKNNQILQTPDQQIHQRFIKPTHSESFPSSTNKINNGKLISTMPKLQCNNDWNRDLYWQKNRIQPYYLVLSLLRKDRIMYVNDSRQKKSISFSQAIKQGLADENFLEILDTETNIKYNFQDALVKGLISMVSSSSTPQLIRSDSTLNENITQMVFKIDGIFDPNKEEWINLKEAVDRNILNSRSGCLRINSTDVCHILNAIDLEIVRSKRIYNCNIKSLPKEITFEIPKTV